MSKGQATRERVIAQATALASEDGLAGVTFGRLAKEVGLSKSGLFAHFDSITEVHLAVVQRSEQLVDSVITDATRRPKTPLERLTASVERWIGWPGRAGLPGGCPIASALFEFDDRDGEVRDAVVAAEAEARAHLAAMVAAAVDSGELRADLDVEQFVWELTGIYLAHHVASRLVRSADAGRRAMAAFEGLVARSHQ